MRLISSLTGILLLAALAAMQVQAAPASPESRTKVVATKKPVAKSKAKARVKAKARANAKLKARTKAKVAPNATTESAGIIASAAKPAVSFAASTAPSSAADRLDETALDAEVVAARRIVAAKPDDTAARRRLAHAAVRLVEGVLQAEAYGDAVRAAHLVQKLTSDLPDVGWRVQNMAQKGDVKARQAAGFLLGRGILLEKNPEKSCTEFVAAATQLATAGWDAAQCLMDAAPDKAWKLMERSAAQGHAAAQEWMGRRCLGEFGATGKDFVCARDYLTQSANQGRSLARMLLAYLLINGHGGEVDVKRALNLYGMAAEQGDAHAQNNLGEILETETGGSKDPEQALRWYERAAASGLGPAQFNAGRLWAVGVGEKRDPVKARMLLIQAEANGISQARQMLDWLDRQDAAAPKATHANGS